MLRAGLCVAAAALLLSGCQIGSVATGETRHETKSIELDKSATARVEIRMGAGELHVKGGTPKLLEAAFDYNVPDWQPIVDYRANGSRGELTVSQPKGASSSFGRTVNTWDVKLNGQVPMDVIASVGAGSATLELGQMNLGNVEVHVGAGEVKLDLRGEPKHDYRVQLRGGVGEATVYLPKDVAIAATATGGIGGISVTGLEKRDGVWINPERVQAATTVRVDASGGVGEIRLIR